MLNLAVYRNVLNPEELLTSQLPPAPDQNAPSVSCPTESLALVICTWSWWCVNSLGKELCCFFNSYMLTFVINFISRSLAWGNFKCTKCTSLCLKSVSYLQRLLGVNLGLHKPNWALCYLTSLLFVEMLEAGLTLSTELSSFWRPWADTAGGNVESPPS